MVQNDMSGRNIEEECRFCSLIKGEVESYIVFEDEVSLAFLDHKPLFHGHCLLIPKTHYETLVDLPTDLISPLFRNVQMITRAVEEGLKSDESFIAINNKISQSIPHLHIHIVPRRMKDGLRGFFWPHHPYRNQDEALKIQKILQSTLGRIRSS